MTGSLALRLFAVCYGLLAHATFAASVGFMALSLWNGMQLGIGPFEGFTAAAANALLVMQFPLVHSWLLSKGGRRALRAIAPWGGGRLETTTYSFLAALQLLVAFGLWSPSGQIWHRPEGVALIAHALVFAAAWIFLVKSLSDAGLALQTGAAGWTAVAQDRAVRYGGMPQSGLFRVCRQPIYLGFALVLLTAPCWTPDWLALCAGWCVYCVVGPRYKEKRWLRIYGDDFLRYRRTVPYMIPRFPR